MSRFNRRRRRTKCFRNPFSRPLGGGCKKRFLHRVFSGVKVAEMSGDRAEHLWRQFAQKVLGLRLPCSRQANSSGGPLITCRTSMGIFKGSPATPGAADTRAAIAYASSGVSTSTTQKPARNSFDSGKTPSVIGSPFLSSSSMAPAYRHGVHHQNVLHYLPLLFAQISLIRNSRSHEPFLDMTNQG